MILCFNILFNFEKFCVYYIEGVLYATKYIILCLEDVNIKQFVNKRKKLQKAEEFCEENRYYYIECF